MKPLRFPTSLRADAGEPGKAKWQQLFPLGTFHNGNWPKSGVKVDTAFCATMLANWKKRGGPALPIDYLHRGADTSLPVEDQAASGWIENLEVRSDGLWAQVKWTEKARALIAADEFRFLSPEFQLQWHDGHTGQPQGPTLIGAGLVNRPAFQEMPRIAAAAAAQPSPQDTTMKNLLAAALAALTLKDDATEEQIAARGLELKTSAEKLEADKEAALKASASALASTEPLQAKVTALTASVEVLVAANKAHEARAKTAEIDGLVKELQNDGKGARITAAQVDSVRALCASAGVETMRKHYTGAPYLVQFGEKGHAGGDGGAESVDGAHKKLQAIAEDLVKAGTPRADAMLAAMTKHPELAESATRKAISVTAVI